MKKKIILSVLVGSLALSTGCSSNEDKEVKDDFKDEVVEVEEDKEEKSDEEIVDSIIDKKEEVMKPQREDSEFLAFQMDISKKLTKSFEEISRLLGNPTYTQDWVLETAGVLFEYETQLDSILNYKYDGELYKDVDKLMKKAATEYKSSIPYITEGVDNADANKLSKATDHMIEGHNYVGKATEEIKRITEELNK